MGRRNRTSNKTLDDEVNATKYPFYPLIPIKNIADKQKKLMNSLYMDIDDTKTIIPKKQLTPVETLPTLSVIPVEGEVNHYKVDLEPLKQKECELKQQIDKNDEIIRSQIASIATNDQILNNQNEQIQSNNAAIYNNNQYIYQQISAINHNTSLITHQAHNINVNNEEIARLNQHINESQDTLDQINYDIENSNGQLEYHNSILGAFNILMQNPQYFMHLLNTMSVYNMVPVEDITNVT